VNVAPSQDEISSCFRLFFPPFPSFLSFMFYFSYPPPPFFKFFLFSLLRHMSSSCDLIVYAGIPSLLLHGSNEELGLELVSAAKDVRPFGWSLLSLLLSS